MAERDERGMPDSGLLFRVGGQIFDLGEALAGGNMEFRNSALQSLVTLFQTNAMASLGSVDDAAQNDPLVDAAVIALLKGWHLTTGEVQDEPTANTTLARLRDIHQALIHYSEASVDTGVATGGTNTTIVDTDKDWEADIWQNALAEVVVAGVSYIRACTGNTNDTVTIAALDPADPTLQVSSGDTYKLKIPINVQDIERIGGTTQTGADWTPLLQAIGLVGDAAETDPTENATSIALLKGLLTALTDGSQTTTLSGKTVSTDTVTIAAAASLSDAVDLETSTLMAVIMPAAWDAAGLTFEVSHNGTDWVDLYNEFGELLVTVADTDRYIHLTPAEWVGVRHVKVRSGTSAAAVAQAAERVITLVVKEL